MPRLDKNRWFLARTAEGVCLGEYTEEQSEHKPIFWSKSFLFEEDQEPIEHINQYPIGASSEGTFYVYSEDLEYKKIILAIDIDDIATASLLAHARLRFNTKNNNPEGIGIVTPDGQEVIIA